MKIAVLAHSRKTVGGGLPELRAELKRRGQPDVTWYEVEKSKKIPKAARAAVGDAPDLFLVWGGDGTVQRALDVLARERGSKAPVGVIPAGTSNLFASNLGIPHDLVAALDVALGGERQVIDVGSFNGERFGVMAGVGFDAMMIGDASRSLKDRLGRVAYIYTGVKNLRRASVEARIDVDGGPWFHGSASCVLVGNMGDLFGGVTIFPDADPADGRLDVAVLQAEKIGEWTRMAGRAITGSLDRSPFLTTVSARRVDVRLKRSVAYELDGGARGRTKRLKIRVKPEAVTVCVPARATVT
jgi:YegS/Rv2252/BmrU family lipid kinase